MRYQKFIIMSVMLCLCFLVVSITQSKTNITYWTWLSAEDATKQFMKIHPDIKVDMIQMGPWDIHDKLLVSIASGSGAPDVAQLVLRRFSDYSTTGKLLDLTPYVEDIKDGYLPEILSFVQYDGKIWGLNVDIAPGVVWYRRDIFEKAGINPTSIVTWEDYLQAGEAIKKATGSFLMPMFVPAGQWGANALALFLHSMGGNIYTKEGTLIRNNQKLRAVLEWLWDVYSVKGLAEGITFFTPEFWAAFKEGRFASWPMNTAEGANIKRYMPELKGKWGAMPFPRWTGMDKALTGFWGGTVLAVPEQSANHIAAVTFIKWFAGTVEGQVAASKAWNAVPAYQPAFEHPFYKEVDPYFGVNIYERINPFEPFYYFDWAETEQIIGNQLDLMFAGKISPEEAATNIEKEIAQSLKR